MQSNGAIRGPDTRNKKDLEEGVGQNSNSSTLLPDMVRTQSEDVKAAARGLDDEKIEAINGSGGVLAKVLSRTQSRCSYIDPGPPPDGGLRAWTQAFMTHLVVFNTWGYINSFGVFQTYYVTALNHPPSAISWVGSVQIFLLFFIGTFSGRATDYGLFRPTVFLGSFLQVLGVFMTSLSTKYWQLFLAQGICTGVGNGLVFCPCLAVVSTYFSKRRSLAIGIGASGTATGGIVYPVIVQQLLPKIGFAWTVRIQAFVMLTISIIALGFLRTRLPPRKSGPIVEWSAFKELSYDLFTIGMFLIFWALYFAIYYIGSFGRNILHISESSSINDLLIINGVGLFGRLIPNHLADRFFGPLNVIIPFAFICGLLLYCWAAVTSPGGLIGFAVTYGLFAAAIQGLFPSVVASLTTDLKKAGVRMGMVFSAISFASLTGPPLGGALIQNDNGRYLDAQMWAGSSLMVGFLMLIASRVVAKGWGLARI
ncbi:hypothetical protein JMJ35_000635 [Cladonia borealis]|uniref:MFS monocarboxylate transporter n=1 Tax=Cladonia borealis TaxID=184061 RepID=A0AA39R9T3_9LECA|nr:hypothetical protein JMJ35_000635 [Cladonia borealis]